MAHELESHIPGMVSILASGDPAREAKCRFYLDHGARHSRFAELFYREYPEELPPYATLDEIRFALHTHDMAKGVCASDLGALDLPIPILEDSDHRDDYLEVISHGSLMSQFLLDYSETGVDIPIVAFEVYDGHHGKVSSPMKVERVIHQNNGAQSDHVETIEEELSALSGVELGPVARLSAIIDQIISRCEDRRPRYETSYTFRQAFDSVKDRTNKIKGELLYDRRILGLIWEMMKNNPHIDEVGFRWLE